MLATLTTLVPYAFAGIPVYLWMQYRNANRPRMIDLSGAKEFTLPEPVEHGPSRW